VDGLSAQDDECGLRPNRPSKSISDMLSCCSIEACAQIAVPSSGLARCAGTPIIETTMLKASPIGFVETRMGNGWQSSTGGNRDLEIVKWWTDLAGNGYAWRHDRGDECCCGWLGVGFWGCLGCLRMRLMCRCGRLL
jgi:hypothetical protein